MVNKVVFNSWFSFDVITTKRFLIGLFCLYYKHGIHAFVISVTLGLFANHPYSDLQLRVAVSVMFRTLYSPKGSLHPSPGKLLAHAQPDKIPGSYLG